MFCKKNLFCSPYVTSGPGIVTRRPLILQLVHSPSRWKKSKKSESDGSDDESPEFEEAEPEEWGKFNHIKDKVSKHVIKFHIFTLFDISV